MKLITMKFPSTKIITVVNVAMGLLLLISLGLFMRDILMVVQKKDMMQASALPVESKNVEKKSMQYYDAIFQRNPFGIPAGSLNNNSSAVNQSALTDMKLIGTISGSAHSDYAVFVGKDGKQSLVKTGESVIGAGELKSVGKYHVFIENNGKLKKISMVDIVAPDELEALRGTGGASGPIRLLGKGDYMIDQKALLFAVDNPTQIMTDAKLIPNMVKDKQEGFILREVRKNGIYDSLGMQNGDVLLRVNNFNISSAESALQAFTALRGMDKVQIDLLRDNNRMSMNYQIR
jgi:type II secretion system protein C